MRKLRIRPAGVVRWLAAISTLVLAACLCASCLDLYWTGIAPENLTEAGVRINDIYTRQNVGEKLLALVPAAICWALLMGAAAMQPKPEKRRKVDPENALRLLAPRVEESQEMKFEREWRDFVEKGGVFVLFACFFFIHKYMKDIEHFTSWDLEQVMADMVRATWIPALIAVVVMCLWAWWTGHSYMKEWQYAKKAPKRETPLPKPAPRKAFPVNAVRAVLAVAAVVLIVLGVLNGGMYDVLVKAINICTECIGLG